LGCDYGYAVDVYDFCTDLYYGGDVAYGIGACE
jgi:hypothetical protein